MNKKICVEFCFDYLPWPIHQKSVNLVEAIKWELSEFYNIVEDVTKADYVLVLCDYTSHILERRMVLALQKKIPMLAMAQSNADAQKFINGIHAFLPNPDLHFIPYDSPENIAPTTLEVMHSLDLVAV